MLTVETATSRDVWPQGSNRSPADEAEIMRIAREEISAEAIARSGSGLAKWYVPFALAEELWRQRADQRVEHAQRQEVEEGANAKRIAELERRLNKLTTAWNSFARCLDPDKDDPDGETVLFKAIRGVFLQEMHERRVMRDAGVWDPARRYGSGAAVTHTGQIWVCQVENQGVSPGDGVAWRLMHKSPVADLRHEIRSIVREEIRKRAEAQ
jgi:hypothetical protein